MTESIQTKATAEIVGAPAPGDCHLYRHYDAAGALLYVGISLSALHRLADHKVASHWFRQIARVTIETLPSRAAALEAERQAIADEKPLHNVMRPGVAKRVEIPDQARDLLLQRVVAVEPVYSMEAAGRLFNVSPGTVGKMVKDGEIGHILVKSRKMITGWQIIDYLEAKGGRKK